MFCWSEFLRAKDSFHLHYRAVETAITVIVFA
jgi:hypothetical protein